MVMSVKLSNEELHSLVKPLCPYKKICRLIPDLASTDTSTSLRSTKAEQTLHSKSRRSLSLVSQLKHAKASMFSCKMVSSLFQALASSKSQTTFNPSAELVVSSEKRKNKCFEFKKVVGRQRPWTRTTCSPIVMCPNMCRSTCHLD